MFAELRSRWAWRPIANCPGRFVFSAGPTRIPPAAIIADDAPITEHHIPTTKDPVLVARFADGGLISYRKPGDTFVHTLNSREGFERKLQQLGISLPVDDDANRADTGGGVP